MNKKGCRMGCLLLLLIFALFVFAFVISSLKSKKIKESYKEPSISYIDETSALALKTAKKYDLFASVVLAQSSLESNFGSSALSSKFHNYFGIKSTTDKGVRLDTLEFIDGKDQVKRELFAVYKNKEESFYAYGELIKNAPRYQAVRDAKTPEEYAHALSKCGYATDPNYAQKIIKIIDNYNLRDLDIKK